MREKLRSEIGRHFKVVLNRPEILNRIGDNIIVFDFIRDDIAEKILRAMTASVLNSVSSAQGIVLTLSESSYLQLAKLCLADLSNGGRGIRNKVETHLINPLARVLFDMAASKGARLEIVELTHDDAGSTDLRIATVGGHSGEAAE